MYTQMSGYGLVLSVALRNMLPGYEGRIDCTSSRIQIIHQDSVNCLLGGGGGGGISNCEQHGAFLF